MQMRSTSRGAGEHEKTLCLQRRRQERDADANRRTILNSPADANLRVFPAPLLPLQLYAVVQCSGHAPSPAHRAPNPPTAWRQLRQPAANPFLCIGYQHARAKFLQVLVTLALALACEMAPAAKSE